MEVGFAFADKEAYNLYEITENLEEYYRQKAPNLWNAWIRTNNMLVEQQEKMDELKNIMKQQQQYLSKLELRIDQQFGGIAKKNSESRKSNISK